MTVYRAKAAWGGLIRKGYEADPLECRGFNVPEMISCEAPL